MTPSMDNTARVMLWGRDIGAVAWLSDLDMAVFQYTPEFARSGIEVVPLMMPLGSDPYDFPALKGETFKGLPGMLADSLPDRFGDSLIDVSLAAQGRSEKSFTPVDRLRHTGARGMGALEFKPAIGGKLADGQRIEIERLVALLNQALGARADLQGKFTGDNDKSAMSDLLHVCTSAGGARAKAVLAWSPGAGEFRSGQAPSEKGFEHWVMKFDGVTANNEREVGAPKGYGRIEYAYHLMAREAGIDMAECRLHEEGGRAHFMTRRFDRTPEGNKIHMQSFGGLMHYDFNIPGGYAYEQALRAIKRLELPSDDLEQQIRRAYFNILARNQDDHVKNIAFLMNQRGEWRLSPAFDVVYSYNPSGMWTDKHQMSLSGKRDGFSIEDLVRFAAAGGLKSAKARGILSEVSEAVNNWERFAKEADMGQTDAARIKLAHRRDLFV